MTQYLASLTNRSQGQPFHKDTTSDLQHLERHQEAHRISLKRTRDKRIPPTRTLISGLYTSSHVLQVTGM